jgi:FkbM family methyltransferase
MDRAHRLKHRIGCVLRRLGAEIMRQGSIEGTWIDVGAHHGETTLDCAIQNPNLRIFAFEPNISAAAKLIGRAQNYFVIPMAVAEVDGVAPFNINATDEASSLLAIDENARLSWTGGESLHVESVMSVPTIRLETFMNLMGIEKIDYLKVDTQGMDLAVVVSAGTRLRDIYKITLEVDITAHRLYKNAPCKAEVVDYLSASGFTLVNADQQTHGQEENLTFIRGDLSPNLPSQKSITLSKPEGSA